MLIQEAAQGLASVPSRKENGMTEYELEHGNVLAFKLLKKTEVAVADTFLSKGSIFPFHKHDGCREILMVYKGQISIVAENLDERVTLKAGDHISLQYSEGHALFAKEDTWMLAVTMPADENFPG